MAPANVIRLDDDRRKGYEDLFASCEVTGARRGDVAAMVKRIMAARARYEAVESATGVPWFVVGAIHSLESGADLQCHLHNGDPLAARTVHWPKNRPSGAPPFSWEQSAKDALTFTGLARWDDWSVAGTLFELESYNGLGYLRYHPDVRSPYLWSFTNHYTKGKYAADRKFDPELVSKQAGAVALFLGLEEALGEALWPRAPRSARFAALAPQSLAGATRAEAPMAYPGRIIERGEANRALVTAVQNALVTRRCGPLEIDGIFGQNTEDSVKLFQSRAETRHGAPLDIDGRVGPLTWEALFGEQSVVTVGTHEQDEPLVAAALAIAETQVGVTEEPPFKDTGDKIREFQASVGVGPGSHWCAAFVYWCFEQAAKEVGVPNPVVRTGHCMTHFREANKLGVPCINAKQAHDDPSLVTPGQVFIMHYGEDKGHTGFVVGVEGGLLETIEGNTDSAGSRSGHGVYRKRQRRIEDINVGFIDYAALTPVARPTGPAPLGEPVAPPEAETVAGLPPIAPLDPSMHCKGLLLRAVKEGAFEQPIWIDVKYGDLIVSVGAHALRANVGGRLLRLPVSYNDVIEICGKLGWVAPTAELCDAIWDAATVHIGPVKMGDWSTKATSAISSKKMTTLEYVLGMNARMDGRIPQNQWNELNDTEGKYWILSRRNLLPSKGGGPESKGVANYGWHELPHGEVVQPLGLDSSWPWHDVDHYDYSQTLRPIKRLARRADGTEVDLLDEAERHGMPAAVLAPFRTKSAV